MFSLRTRIALLLFCVIILNLAGAGITLWYTNRTQSLQVQLSAKNVAALEASHGLSASLMDQKGNTTYYLLSHDDAWLKELDTKRELFEGWLKKAKESAFSPESSLVLADLEKLYAEYDASRKEVIELYKEGQPQAGAELHWKIRDEFNTLLLLSKEFRALYLHAVEQNRIEFEEEAEIFSDTIVAGLILSALIEILLIVFLYRKILDPIRTLAHATGDVGESGALSTKNDVLALSNKVESLITHIDDAQKELDAKKETLVHSEKLALVGKLAAGVAHSIRNPLTSVKMRLFSLERSLELDEQQQEDFDVVSEEISHIDNITKNFLEFSRRPELKAKIQSPSEVVDMALRLLKYRFESQEVNVSVERTGILPAIPIDGGQLKEVLVNLLLNACDAMVQGGSITITEKTDVVDPLGTIVFIRIEDTGPGVSEEVLEKIFEPFFSTKEEGSGLGLAIARRIVEEHGGWLHATSVENQGTTFLLALPATRGNTWQKFS
ncbi:ATP-binding protein [Halodesulfovibrio marinisediminis]|uniref:histidine kinase n=1 Tax=Halodesulfovibrio marinisediminis DSM 17456 TaxID=1121457 RepID=A0A1N6IGL8_9BACT|nr:ATP-binding protein [Halodesulfovibrio marinisediminis]SIO31167.1 Four helix bundle sensory module for signal transduction [Halodesulfovibrio marinisediminis DSM 17456]